MNTSAKKAWVVSLTPFDAAGGIDEAAFRTHLRWLRDGGQSAYVGSTNVGEGFSLDQTELAALFRIASSELKGSGVRSAGCEARSVAEALVTVRAAEAAKLDAVHLFQLDVGHGTSKPDAAELERYYSAVIEKAAIPVVVSNYPALGYTVPLEVIGKLLDRFPQIIAVRDAGGDAVYFSELMSRFGGRAEIYSTGVKNLLSSLALGAHAVFTTEANVAPGLVSSVLRHFESGDVPALREAFGKLVRLHALLGRYGGAAGRGMKPLLAHFGLPGGEVRLPRQPVSGDALAALISGVARLELPDWPRPA